MTTVSAGFENVLRAEMSFQEIDFGEHGGDDIDIDIDLETGQNDEDYMLDDIHSDTGNEEGGVGNDDVMIDDEHASYPMDDVDIVQDEHVNNLQMEDADLSDLPVPQTINQGIDFIDGEKAALFTTGSGESSEAFMDESSHREDPPRVPQVGDTSKENTLIEDTEVSSNRRELADDRLSPLTSPNAQDHGGSTDADQHTSLYLPDTTPSFNADIKGGDPIDAIVISEGITNAGKSGAEIDHKSDQGDSIILAAEKVLVVYRNMEYSLISTSETDDPDSFFFKDGDLIKGSLADLFAGLREVIHNDLGLEDELCLAVEDLGIEICETCVSVHDLSFASVIDLYEKLLHNDGVEMPGPLYVTLGTKPDFAKRLAKLTTGAVDGKGLSELITWDESENPEEDDQSGLDEEDREIEEGGEEAEGLNQFSDIYGNRFAHDTIVDEPLEGGMNSKNKTSQAADAEELKGDNGQQVSEDLTRPVTSDNTIGQNTIQGQQRAYRHQSSDVDEDGDLIDYEEEENEQDQNTFASTTDATKVVNSDEQNGKLPDFIEPCLKSLRTACFCPACNERLLIYYEEKNNELRRRSLSLAAERDESPVSPDLNAGNGPASQTEHDLNANANHGADDDGEYSGYQQYEEEENQLPNPEEKYEENTHDSDEFQAPYSEDIQQGEDENGNVVPDATALNTEDAFEPEELDHQEGAVEIEDEDFDEIDYDTTAQDATHSHLADYLVAPPGGSASAENDQDTDEISYEEADDPESNDSERTLIADVPIHDPETDEPEHAHDEINYDTDDQQDLNKSSDRNVSNEASPSSNGHAGKRQRVDAEDVTDRALKQSKRARS